MGARSKPRASQTVGAWFANQIWNTSLPWLLFLFFVGTGFYWVTNSTLAVHTDQLTRLATAVEENKKTAAANRDSARNEFLADSKATAAGIAKLNETTAVMGETLRGVQKELEKISQRLDSIPQKR